MKSITPREIDNILHFVRLKSLDLQKYYNIQPEKIIVAIPNWIVYVIMDAPMYKINYSPYPDKWADWTLCGVKKQPHYKDEIVVFFENYHYDPERFMPQVYEIKTT